MCMAGDDERLLPHLSNRLCSNQLRSDLSRGQMYYTCMREIDRSPTPVSWDKKFYAHSFGGEIYKGLLQHTVGTELTLIPAESEYLANRTHR